MEVKGPLLTILIASYNRLELLKSCFSSVLAQDLDNCEILIVDDGSSNPTKDWLKSLKHEKLRVIYQNNLGVSKARQVGLRKSKGQYIFILDSDDIILSQGLEEMKNNINYYNDVDIFFCNNLEIYPEGKSRVSNYPEYSSSKSFINNILVRPRVPFKHSGTTFKKDLAINIGGYNEALDSKIDIDFVVKFLQASSKFRLVKNPLIGFLFHRNSISRKKRINGLLIWWMIIKKYGPNSKLKNSIFRLKRTFFEILKFFYEKLRL